MCIYLKNVSPMSLIHYLLSAPLIYSFNFENCTVGFRSKTTIQSGVGAGAVRVGAGATGFWGPVTEPSKCEGSATLNIL